MTLPSNIDDEFLRCDRCRVLFEAEVDNDFIQCHCGVKGLVHKHLASAVIEPESRVEVK